MWSNLRRYVCVAAVVALAATSGCASDDANLGAREQESGLCWGPCPTTSAESELADPVVRFLDEYRPDRMRSALRVAVGPTGTIAVTDPDARLVHVLSPRGTPKFKLEVGLPLGVAIDGAGNIYVGDGQTGAVLIYDSVGESTGFLGDGPGEFSQPTELLWVPTDGTIHVADSATSHMSVYSTFGAFQFDYGFAGTGAGGFHFPNGLVFDEAEERIYVTDHSNARIQVFDLFGTYQTAFGTYGSKKGMLNRPGGTALDEDGRLYVTDAFQHTLQVLDTDGLHVSYLGEPGTLRSQVKLSADAVLDPFHRLLVTSHGTGKLLVYGIDDFTEPPPEIPPPLPANVTVAPSTLYAAGGGRWVSVTIEVPDRDAVDLIVASLRLQGIPPDPAGPTSLGDADSDGVPDLTLKFSRSDLIVALPGAGTHVVVLTGELQTGGTIEGVATVVVLASGGG